MRILFFLFFFYSVSTHLQVEPCSLFTFLSPPTTAQSTSLSPSAELPVLFLSNFYQEFHFELLINSARAPLLPPVQMNKRAGKQTDK